MSRGREKECIAMKKNEVNSTKLYARKPTPSELEAARRSANLRATKKEIEKGVAAMIKEVEKIKGSNDEFERSIMTLGLSSSVGAPYRIATTRKAFDIIAGDLFSLRVVLEGGETKEFDSVRNAKGFHVITTEEDFYQYGVEIFPVGSVIHTTNARRRAVAVCMYEEEGIAIRGEITLKKKERILPKIGKYCVYGKLDFSAKSDNLNKEPNVVEAGRFIMDCEDSYFPDDLHAMFKKEAEIFKAARPSFGTGGVEVIPLPTFAISRTAARNLHGGGKDLFSELEELSEKTGNPFDNLLKVWEEEGNGIIRRGNALIRSGEGEVLTTLFQWKSTLERLIFIGVFRFFYKQHADAFDLRGNVRKKKGADYYVVLPVGELTTLIYGSGAASSAKRREVLEKIRELSSRTCSVEIWNKKERKTEIKMIKGLWALGNEIITDAKTGAKLVKITPESKFYESIVEEGFVQIPDNFFDIFRGSKNAIALSAFLYVCQQLSYKTTFSIGERRFREQVEEGAEIKKNYTKEKKKELFAEALDIVRKGGFEVKREERPSGYCLIFTKKRTAKEIE